MTGALVGLGLVGAMKTDAAESQEVVSAAPDRASQTEKALDVDIEPTIDGDAKYNVRQMTEGVLLEVDGLLEDFHLTAEEKFGTGVFAGTVQTVDLKVTGEDWALDQTEKVQIAVNALDLPKSCAVDLVTKDAGGVSEVKVKGRVELEEEEAEKAVVVPKNSAQKAEAANMSLAAYEAVENMYLPKKLSFIEKAKVDLASPELLKEIDGYLLDVDPQLTEEERGQVVVRLVAIAFDSSVSSSPDEVTDSEALALLAAKREAIPSLEYQRIKGLTVTCAYTPNQAERYLISAGESVQQGLQAIGLDVEAEYEVENDEATITLNVSGRLKDGKAITDVEKFLDKNAGYLNKPGCSFENGVKVKNTAGANVSELSFVRLSCPIIDSE